MGKRKRDMANRLKEERQQKAYAILRDCPSSPRKMRLVVDLVRGKDVNSALNILRYTPKHAAVPSNAGGCGFNFRSES